MRTIEAEHGVSEESEKAEAFQEQQPIMDQIKAMGFDRYVQAKVAGISNAFDTEKYKPSDGLQRCVGCMDERVKNVALHLAGSGAIMSAKDMAVYLREAQPGSVSWHEGCGAAKICAQEMGRNAEDPVEVDKVAKDFAEQLAKEINKPCIKIDMSAEKPFHNARVCYYDGTGRFNYSGVDGLPAGFIIGRRYMKPKYALKEADIARQIIFGDHGYGPELLNKENPFLFVAVGDTPAQVEDLKAELVELTDSLDEDVAVSLDGFVAPKKIEVREG